jgi:hypothetical protein
MRATVPSVTLLATLLITGCNNPAFEWPRAFQVGAMPDSLRPLLTADCDRLEEHHYTGATAAPFTEQTQVDCFGLQVLGAQRKVEFLFNDGPLGHLWVHVDSTELGRIDSLLIREFGPVVHRSPEYHVYRAGTVALRFAPPEVLIATPELVVELSRYRPPDETR